MAKIYTNALFSMDTVGSPFTENVIDIPSYSTPHNTLTVYAKTDGNLYVTTNAGVITQLAYVSGSVATAGTVTTPAQPAITSVGTLTSLVVSGLTTLGSYAKAALPTATSVGQVIYVSDATGAHVTGSVAFANATGSANWIDVTTGIAIA